MMSWLLLAGAYFGGSLPIGLLVAKLWKGIDVREHGSGNIGATNVYRVVGPIAGTLVFLLDVLKGFWPPMAGRAMGLNAEWLVALGMAAILGHNFSPFLGFKGGKGIATSLGVLFGVAPKVGFTAFALWIVVVLVTRYVSVASILAAASLAPLMLVFYPGQPTLFGFGLAAGLFAIYKHKGNIKRLMAGTENRFGKSGKTSDESEQPDIDSKQRAEEQESKSAGSDND